MAENESLSEQKRTTWNRKRLILLAVLVIPVVTVLVVIMVLQPWSVANKFHNDMTKANAAMSDIESCRVVGSSTYDDPDGSFSQLSMEGEFTSSDRYYMEVANSDEVSEFIIIGDILFVNNERFFSPSSFAFMQYYRN